MRDGVVTEWLRLQIGDKSLRWPTEEGPFTPWRRDIYHSWVVPERQIS